MMARGIVNNEDLYCPSFFPYTRQVYSLPISQNFAPSAPCQLLLFEMATRMFNVLAAAFSASSRRRNAVSLVLKYLSDTQYILKNHVPRHNVFTVSGGTKFLTSMIHVCLPSSFSKHITTT